MKKAPTWENLSRVSQQAGDPTWGTVCTVLGTTQMECSQRSAASASHREAGNALKKETKTGAQATLAHSVPGRGSEPDILPSAYRQADKIGRWTEALEVITEITGMI